MSYKQTSGTLFITKSDGSVEKVGNAEEDDLVEEFVDDGVTEQLFTPNQGWAFTMYADEPEVVADVEAEELT